MLKLISSEEILKTPIFRVTMDHAVDPDGFEIRRAIVQHAGSAVMMAVDQKGRILLVRQYRMPARSYLWELPAGRLDPGESALKAARRELREETGYRAKRWTKMIEFWPSPGFLGEKMTIWLAQELTAGRQQPMDDERIECRWFTPAEVAQMIARREIADAKTLIGWSQWKLNGKRFRGSK
jgi:ADP-ribose pyrophosphatase